MANTRDCDASYTPIRDYALIGDCHGAALVGRGGSIDWCSLARFDADPVFCRVLDAGKGGFFAISPDEPAVVTRAYLEATAILQTRFQTPAGAVRLTDFMPVRSRSTGAEDDDESLSAPFWLVRMLEGEAGEVRVRVRFRPSSDFARTPVRLERLEDGLRVPGGPALFAPRVAFSCRADKAEAEIALKPGERYCFAVVNDPDKDRAPMQDAVIDEAFRATKTFWQRWAQRCRYHGPYRSLVLRSALTLKLLTYAPTGAIVAAPSCSLPEQIGGIRNWDYRYCWIRDATFALYALTVLGYRGEAQRFSDFLYRECEGSASAGIIQIMYGINGETKLNETDFDHLEGYCKSRPVRVGNAAYDQEQLDAYGEVLSWAYLHQSLGGRLGPRKRKTLERLADHVKAHWRDRGSSLWEVRGPPRDYVFGKIMCWSALHNAEALFGARDDWTAAREQIRTTIEARGIEPGLGYLRQAFDHPAADASLLMAPLVGFPLADAVLHATIDRIRKELGHGDFLRRYQREDCLPGREGAFLICSFWLVDALLITDRGAEAQALYERLLEKANDVGLFSEEIDPATGAFLGNFPQAFTHLALIDNAVHLALYRAQGAAALRGTRTERIHRVIEAMTGAEAHATMVKKPSG